MKELIKFSLRRRFLNKATLFFNIIFLLITIVVFNLDKVMAIIQPEINEAILLYTDNNKLRLDIITDERFEFYPQAEIKIKVEDNNYIVSSEQLLNNYQSKAIIELIDKNYDNLKRSEEEKGLMQYYDNFLALNIEFNNNSTSQKNNSNVLAFVVITTIYFMMISFSAMAANEVIYEKSTRLLETILTTLSVSAHFFGKMLIGWLNIIIQSLLSGTIVLSVFVWRYSLDQGTKLCRCLQKLDLIDSSINSLKDLSKLVAVDSSFIGDMFLIMIILMLGIVSVQVIMVSVSSFVSNVEEAGNIQSPMYILFMGLYYFSLSMSQASQLQKGLGKLCSYLPLTSMLFMPYRILLTKTKISAVFLSIGINTAFLVICLVLGRFLYGKGILYHKAARIKKKRKGTLIIGKKSFSQSE